MLTYQTRTRNKENILSSSARQLISRDIDDFRGSNSVCYPVSAPLRQLQLAQLSLHYVLDDLFPVIYNSKKGGGGETFEITKAASPTIMFETRYSSHS